MSEGHLCALFDGSVKKCGVTGEDCDKKTEEEVTNCEVKKDMYKELG